LCLFVFVCVCVCLCLFLPLCMCVKKIITKEDLKLTRYHEKP
jgi:hypothetical protein